MKELFKKVVHESYQIVALALMLLVDRVGIRVKFLHLQEQGVNLLPIGSKRLMVVETGTLLVFNYKVRDCASVRYFAVPGHDFGDVDLFILPGSLKKILEVC